MEWETEQERKQRMAEQDALYEVFQDLATMHEEMKPALSTEVEMLERQRISDALSKAQGNQTKAAKDLKIGRTNLIAKMKKYGFTSV